MNNAPDNREMLQQLKDAADALNGGAGEDELRSRLLAGGMDARAVDMYIDIAVRYNDLTYRRTGIRFFLAGLAFLVLGVALMLVNIWVLPMAMWPHYVLPACIAAAGVNLGLGFWRVVLHRNPRAEEAASRMRQREQTGEQNNDE